MSRANQACARGDAEAFEPLLRGWAHTPRAVFADGVAGELIRVIRAIARAKRRLDEIAHHKEALPASTM